MRRIFDSQPAALPASSLLQLMWLASPALPIGGFSYSEGLEAGIESARIAPDSIANWLQDQLHISLARGDLAALCKAVAAIRRDDAQRVQELNAWVLQTRETHELRLQTEQMGRSLVEWLKAQAPELDVTQWLGDQVPSYAVAFALAATRTQASARDIALTFTFGWAENMVQAAIKAVPLGQTAGQRILQQLATEIPSAVEIALQLPDGERQAFTPMLAILSAQHETQYSRLFRS
ncbi:urease accessory UreF family protein [Variovorax sp. PCZ-1]|uniref:urease accessory protein UreF n=1 Tax=Variovorax sp. PCZ-1 TaxID=2835533 RepID=UPI001BCBAEBE|nr:urease accessory UreF family protein [Variovorax sp. PCZ-1]MBS7806737.1 urease accessory protein UreF [Variovorax sp. PCZ-1]